MHRPRGSRIADLGSQHHLLICHTGHGTKPTAAFFLQGFSLHHTSPKERRVSLAPSFQYEWHFLKPHPLPYPTLGPGRRETRTLTSDFLIPIIIPDWKGKLCVLLSTSYLPPTRGQQDPWISLQRQNRNLLNMSGRNWMIWAHRTLFLIGFRYLEKPLSLVDRAHHLNK